VIDIAIKTIDRSPKKNFLGETIKNLRRGGVFKSEHLGKLWIVDGGSRDVWTYLKSQGVTEVLRHQVDHAKRSMHQNAQRCIDLASSGTADFALVLEDDIDVCRNFLESVVAWLGDHELSTPMMYVFGANYAQIAVEAKKGIRFWNYPCDSFYGALACGWSAPVARDLARWLGPDPFYKKKDGEEVRTHGHDLLLGRWGSFLKLHHFLAAAPNFVQHIGAESSLNNKSVSYPGFDREWSYV
jgi:hypothetical protein